MPTPRNTSGERRAARTQLRVADQSARVAKDTRAKEEYGEIVVPLKHKDKEGKVHTRDFRLAEDVGIMPLMEWAASADANVASAEGLRAVYYVLQDAVHEDDWHEFRKYARESKVGASELLDFANSALEALAGRPTEDASGSSAGS